MQSKSVQVEVLAVGKGSVQEASEGLGRCMIAALSEGKDTEVVVVRFSWGCRGDEGSGRIVLMCL